MTRDEYNEYRSRAAELRKNVKRNHGKLSIINGYLQVNASSEFKQKVNALYESYGYKAVNIDYPCGLKSSH